MTRTEKLARWYRKGGPLVRILMQGAGSFVIFYGGSILEQVAQDDFKNSSVGAFTVRAVFVLGMFLIFFGIAFALRKRLQYMEAREAARQRQLAYAHSLMDQFLSRQVAAVRRIIPDQPITSGESGQNRSATPILQFIASGDPLGEIVQAVYQLFESHFGHSELIDDKIDFETTFITRSFQDGELTIAAWANRNGRAPLSLNKRAENPKVYRDTIAAMLYADSRPVLRIIKDTAKPEERYVELYPGQKERIRSSLVFPVLSDQNTMLGALVVHCNQVGFFVEGDRVFWQELLEVFAKRVALERSRLDLVFAEGVVPLVGAHVPAKPF